MTRFGLRRRVASFVRKVASRVEPEVDASTPAPSPDGVVDVAPEDVQLDAFVVLDKQGIGVDFAFVDVREDAEVARTGTIEGALHIPVRELAKRVAEVPTDLPVVCVCASGIRSTDAAMTLRAAGHPDAWSLVGGVAAWTREGGTLS